MLLAFQRVIKNALQQAIKQSFAIDLSANDIVVEFPPKTEMGDLAFPIGFELAKRLKAITGAKQNPRQLTEKLRNELAPIAGIARIETAGAGYLNFFLARGEFFSQILASGPQVRLEEITGGKLIVEHTSINPNKAAHIGHLRNAVLGDTIVRLLRASGEEVEVHNYIDNTGVQVADVVVGFKYLEKKSLAEIQQIPEPFDYYCWDLYAQVGKFYEEAAENKQLRAQTLHEIEHQKDDTAQIGDYISQRILKCHLKTMWRLGITYDVLPRESDILQLNFWQTAFEKLKANNAIYFETEGRSKGCWVMRAEGKIESEVVAETDQPETESQYEADKILVRSNGTVTYTGKDIAYHLWKLGQLGLDFNYSDFYTYPNGKHVWLTTSNSAEASKESFAFGNGVAYFNVIDVGQSYPQAYVKLGVKLLSTDNRIERSAHLGYEKVVLTPASAQELGYELSEAESKRSQISMSGRKGLGVKADDLITKLEEQALLKVKEHQEEANEADQQLMAHQVAISALRYFILKYTRNSVIAFDFDEALAFQGETGPYLLYAKVRINSIFRKLLAQGGSLDVQLTAEQISVLLSLKDESNHWQGDFLWSLIAMASKLPDVIRLAVNTLEPTHVAKYGYQLAASFNEFFNFKRDGKYVYKIIDEPDRERQQMLVAIAKYIDQQLGEILNILGIEAPDRM